MTSRLTLGARRPPSTRFASASAHLALPHQGHSRSSPPPPGRAAQPPRRGDDDLLLVNAGPERRDEGLRLLAESHALGTRLGLEHFASGAAYNLAARYLALGRFDEGRRQLRCTVECNRRHQIRLIEPWPVLDLWRLDGRCGRWRNAFEELPGIEAFVDDADRLSTGQAFVLIRLASFEVDAGRVLRARARLDAHGPDLEPVADPQRRLPYLRERLRIAVALAQPDEADARAAETFASPGECATAWRRRACCRPPPSRTRRCSCSPRMRSCGSLPARSRVWTWPRPSYCRIPVAAGA